MTYGFDHIHIKAFDPEKAANWYVSAFKFEIVNDFVRDVGDRFLECRTSDGVTVNISGARTNERLGNADASAHWGLEHFGIYVDDMDAELARLQGLGAELLEGPMDGAGGGRIAFISTPGDVRIELIQSPG